MTTLNPETIVPPSAPAVTRGKFFLYALIIIIFLGGGWLLQQPRVQVTIVEWNKHSLWENVKRLSGGDDLLLKGESEGRINFLILGQGGVVHDGPYLTDTIILASVKPDTKQVALLSIPRDLVVNIPGFGIKKINSANAYGEEKGAGQGAVLATAVVEKLVNLPIHYYIRLDFAGFKKIIDQAGGVSINIERGFVDNQYPTEKNGYTTISFDAGWQLLSGEQTLQYARSRHGNNGESSDFARAKRQQQVLLAVKEKLFSASTLFNPSLVLKLYRTFSQSVTTNLEAGEAVKLVHLIRAIKSKDIATRVLDTSPVGLLHETTGIDGAYLLTPNVPDYSEIKNLANNIFDINRVAAEEAKIIVENGTTTAGLGEATALSLKSQGFNITQVVNAANGDFTRTLLYDYSGDSKPITRQILETIFHIQALSLEKPSEDASLPDFRIILGANYLTP